MLPEFLWFLCPCAPGLAVWADVPARNVWLVSRTSQLACHDDVLGLICARVPVYLCVDFSFSLCSPSLSLSLSLSLCLSFFLSFSLSLSICISLSLVPFYLSIYPFAYVSICLCVCLSIYLPIYLSVCLSVCQPVAAAWCHSSIVSSLPVVVDLGVCLTFLLVAWPCGCLVVCVQLCPAVLWCLDLMLISTCGFSVLSVVDGMSLSLPGCLRAA